MNILTLLIQGKAIPAVATATSATSATVATEDRGQVESVAKIATVAVAESSILLPVWCHKSCPCLEELDLPDGKIRGCVQEHSIWKQEWKRLNSMKKCPLRMQKQGKKG